MQKIKILLVFIFLSTITACSATGPRYSELPSLDLSESSEIIIFRENKLAASGSKYCIKIDGKTIGVLSSGGFLRIEVQPGQHLVSIPSFIRRDPPTELTVDAKKNSKTYLLHSIDLASMFVLPIGNVTAVSSSWDKKLVELPEVYWVENSEKFKEAKVTNVCNM